MAIVPIYTREGQGQARDRDIQPWSDEGLSLWDSFFRRGSLFDPFIFRDPFEAFPLWDYTPSSLFSKDAQAVANTHVDWWESADAHIIQADLPGVTKEEVEVVVENGSVVQISGRSKKGGPPEGMKCRRGERSRVGYLRRLRLPLNADSNQLKAEMENGVLTITIPKLSPSSSDAVRVVEIEE